MVELTFRRVGDAVGAGGGDQAAATHAQRQRRKKRRRLRLHAEDTVARVVLPYANADLRYSIGRAGKFVIIARAGPFVVRQKNVITFGFAATAAWALQALCSGVLDWNGGEVRLRVVSVSLQLGASHCLLPRGGTTRRVLVS